MTILGTSKVSKTGRTTLPRSVRRALALEAGDKVVLSVTDGVVSISAISAPEPFEVFTEWSSPADEAAYADL